MSDRLIVLATFDTAIAAEIAKATLADAGIESRLGDENLVSTLWHFSNALGGIKLYVHERDAERALAIFREMEVHTQSYVDDEELARQAIAADRDETDTTENETPTSMLADQTKSPIQPDVPSFPTSLESAERERQALRLFFIVWISYAIPCLIPYAIYIWFRAALGPGELSRLGRLKLSVGSGLTFCLILLWVVLIFSIVCP